MDCSGIALRLSFYWILCQQLDNKGTRSPLLFYILRLYVLWLQLDFRIAYRLQRLQLCSWGLVTLLACLLGPVGCLPSPVLSLLSLVSLVGHSVNSRPCSIYPGCMFSNCEILGLRIDCNSREGRFGMVRVLTCGLGLRKGPICEYCTYTQLSCTLSMICMFVTLRSYGLAHLSGHRQILDVWDL